MRSILDKPASYILLQVLNKNNKKKSDENISKLERNI
jgi:hypothetical protein